MTIKNFFKQFWEEDSTDKKVDVRVTTKSNRESDSAIDKRSKNCDTEVCAYGDDYSDKETTLGDAGEVPMGNKVKSKATEFKNPIDRNRSENMSGEMKERPYTTSRDSDV